MHKNEIKLGILVSILIVSLAISRLFPHPWGFTPMIAIFLLSAAYVKDSILRIALPLAVVFFSDCLIQFTGGQGFHNGTLVVYGSYILVSLLSYRVLQNVNPGKIVLSSLLGSVIFFLVTNFAFFYPSVAVSNISLGQYTHDLAGIKASYVSALPYFRNALLGDLFYTAILFGVYKLIQKVAPKLA